MGLPTRITQARAKELETEFSTMWERLSAIVKELDLHGEYGLKVSVGQAAGKLWTARKAVQTRASRVNV